MIRRTRRDYCACRNRAGDVDLTLPLLEKTLAAHGHRPTERFHGKQPFVGYIDVADKSRVAGRFFPSRNGILVIRHPNAAITQATINHELAHWHAYEEGCGGTRDGQRHHCDYVGQHDRRFYTILEAIHKASGITPRDARVPEGDYKYPAHWRKAVWS